MQICVVGTGYVGLTAAVALAHLGHWVTGVDVDPRKVALLKSGRVPFFEPGVETLLVRGLAEGRLQFSTSLPLGIQGADVVFLAVGTPRGSGGEADLSALEAVVAQLASLPGPTPVLVIKSTVPVGTADWVEAKLRQDSGRLWQVVSNPEFLREGSALRDFLEPDRIVIGTPSRQAAETVKEVYARLNAPVLVTERRTAELIKYASNAFLATKISFINEIADLCEAVAVDVTEVSRGIGLDHRIGPHFLRAGLGYGGSCFPKDVASLRHQFRQAGVESAILDAVAKVNASRRARFVDLVRSRLQALDGAVLAVWGVAFKPHTDDVREAPALDIIPALQREGARVRTCDPAVGKRAAEYFPGVEVYADPLEAAEGADAVLVLTEWPQFAGVDRFELRRRMRRPLIVDGRHLFEPEPWTEAGFEYCALGRTPRLPSVRV